MLGRKRRFVHLFDRASAGRVPRVEAASVQHTGAMPGPAVDTSVPIGDYAVLGDGRTAALVSRNGSVDWLCLPGFDSAACFAALLGDRHHGRWQLTVRDATTVTRRYLPDSFVLETTYTCASGRAVVRDVMPLGDGRADLVRRLDCLEGTVTVEHEWIVRFGYGAIKPWVMRVQDHDGERAIRATAGPDSLVLRGDPLPHASGHTHTDTFDVSAGQSVEFSLTWVRSWQPVPARVTMPDKFHATTVRWSRWARGCHYQGSYRDAVVRSLLVLRLLTDFETGGIVAAPTTSLPETFGGERNWDYRYCWLRDAAHTLEALLEYGYLEEATGWRDWLLRAVAGDPSDLQIMYRVDGGRDLPERELGHLPGYARSRPVRIGNAAVGQAQNDVLGEVMCALHHARQSGLDETTASWSLQCHLINDLVSHWRDPDRGIWEIRGALRHFTHSKIMSWVALDRAVRGIEEHGLKGPLDAWRTARDEIRADVLTHGYDPALGTLVEYYGSSHTDAALLQTAQVGFLEATDPRFVGTVAAVRRELEVDNGLLLRYRPQQLDDGLRSEESPFLACSFWLVDAVARQGDVPEARRLLDRLTGLMNDVGLLSEEYDPVEGRMVGNFPQALSHLALVRAVHSYELALSSATAIGDRSTT
jgi:GH15 family glucan-1,4-alpha-glucosidase